MLNRLPRHGGADCFYRYTTAYGSPSVHGATEPLEGGEQTSYQSK